MAKKNILTHSKKKKGLASVQNNQFAEAREIYAQICSIDRTDADAWFMLATICGKLDDIEGAEAGFRQTVRLQPEHALAHYNLGMLLRSKKQLDEAIHELREAARLAPLRAEAHIGLASAYLELNQPEGAASCYRELVKIKPDDPEMHYNLGLSLQLIGHLDDAIGCYKKSLKLKPGSVPVHENMAGTYCNQGLYEEALVHHRQVLQLNPNNEYYRSNFLLTLHYIPDRNLQEIFSEHKKWGEIHSFVSSVPQKHENSPDPERRLRIGYVSPDFRTHSVAYFIEPLFANHDRGNFDTVCYSASNRSDTTTERLRGMVNGWREIVTVEDEQVARLIRDDQIDILVDLAGHTGGTRLKLFSYKPAPVQVTYLGYPDTTGLAAIDYRLTDALADPPGHGDSLYTEKLVRLPGCFLCYQPPADCPEVSSLPAAQSEHVTFGSFNNLSKINAKVIALWADLVKQIANARLFIKNPSFTDPPTRKRYYDMFEKHGVTGGQIELRGRSFSTAEHLELYSQLDIALDTFPYNGTTTTCEAIWMGVPVITLAGTTHAGRVSSSLLTCMGMKELIAQTPEQYLAIAAKTAGDTQKLAALRASLRQRIADSPLCDGKAFARKVEIAYRDMWRTWCMS